MAMKSKRRKHLVKQQIGVVITDLEKVISELNTVVRELKGVLNQIEKVSTCLDDEQCQKEADREARRGRRVAAKKAAGTKGCDNGPLQLAAAVRSGSPCRCVHLPQLVAVRHGLNGAAKCAFASCGSPTRKCPGDRGASPHAHLAQARSAASSGPASRRGSDGGATTDSSWCSSPRHHADWDLLLQQRSPAFPSPDHSLSAKLSRPGSCGSQTSFVSELDGQSSDFQADYNHDINTWTAYAMVHIDASSDAWSADEAAVSGEVLSPSHSLHSGEKRIMHVSPLAVETV